MHAPKHEAVRAENCSCLSQAKPSNVPCNTIVSTRGTTKSGHRRARHLFMLFCGPTGLVMHAHTPSECMTICHGLIAIIDSALRRTWYSDLLAIGELHFVVVWLSLQWVCCLAVYEWQQLSICTKCYMVRIQMFLISPRVLISCLAEKGTFYSRSSAMLLITAPCFIYRPSAYFCHVT